MKIYTVYRDFNGALKVYEAEAKETNKFYIIQRQEGDRRHPGLEWDCSNRHNKDGVSLSREDAIQKFIKGNESKIRSLSYRIDQLDRQIEEAKKL